MASGLPLRTGARARAPLWTIALFGFAVAGCSEGPTTDPPGSDLPIISAEPPFLRASDGLPIESELQEVMQLQLRRDGEALTARLTAASPAVRARAALALGSVQWTGASTSLAALLRDAEVSVRADAAFALGQISGSGVGAALLRALGEEEDLLVRERLIEALGKSGDANSIATLVDLDAGPLEEVRALALSRALLRGIDVPAARSKLAGLVAHESTGAREAAAHYFVQMGAPELWSEHLDAFRVALDGAPLDDPMAMYLVPAIAQQRAPEDRERILHWLENARDWRIRTNVARALGGLAWIEREGVREALFRALDDPAEQVAIVAAGSLTRGLWVPPGVLARMESILREDSIERWRIHAGFLRPVSQFGDGEAVLAWTRRVSGIPLALAHGLAALAETGLPALQTLVLEAAGNPDPAVRIVGISALVGSWQTLVMMGMEEEALYPRFVSALEEGPAPAAAYAASALAHPVFAEMGGDDAVYGAGVSWLERGEVSVAQIMASALTELRDPRGIELAAAADGAMVNARPDWELLAGLGPFPRLYIETSRGEIIARLSAEQAPLTVQMLAEFSATGRYEGVPFHQLEPNFVIQGGDVAMADGSGIPGVRLPSEFTTIPFRRGTLGMASRGKDTEGSQFFLLHSSQPHLDGVFTSFGWVESGFDVLDRLGVGDRVLRMRVEADPG